MQGKKASFFLIVVLLCLTGCMGGPGKGNLHISNQTDEVLKVSYKGPIFGFVKVEPKSTEKVRIVVGEYHVTASTVGGSNKLASQTTYVGGFGSHVAFRNKNPR
jgi:hypothetical protein